MNLKNTTQEGFPVPIKINIFYLGFLLGNFTLKEVGRPPKVGILYEMGKTVQGGFSGPGKIGYTL